MKAFERIFLYSVLVILVFYVFLVDNNAESQVAIQEEIRARSIVIVNDVGQEVVLLSASANGSCKWQVEMHLARKTILHLLERKKWFNPPLLFEF